jgi:hypothetical protein
MRVFYYLKPDRFYSFFESNEDWAWDHNKKVIVSQNRFQATLGSARNGLKYILSE